jgi:TatA/E family protein of Tat protein translocase
MIGTTEWIIIGTIAVFLFGAPAVLKWARTLGQSKKEFINASKEFEAETKA